MPTADTVLQQWRAGERRLDAAPAEQQPTLQRVTELLVVELRRRLGSTFTTAELIDLYDRGTDWCLELAHAIAPGAPYAWDQRTVTDAAFARYSSRAADNAGGRIIDLDS